MAVRLVCASLLVSLLTALAAFALAMDEIDPAVAGTGAVVTVLLVLSSATTLVSAGLAYGLLRRSALVWLLLLLLLLGSAPACWAAVESLRMIGLLSFASSAVTTGALLWPLTVRWCWMEKRERMPQPVLDLRRPD